MSVPVVSFAKVAEASKKGEDFACTLLTGDGPPAAFAIFDGHSGQETARRCSELLCQRLMEKGPPFQGMAIVDMFWAMDEEIGVSQTSKDGATAQIMLVEKSGDTLKGTFAWCGDSSAVVANMSDGSVVYSTQSHTAGARPLYLGLIEKSPTQNRHRTSMCWPKAARQMPTCLMHCCEHKPHMHETKER